MTEWLKRWAAELALGRIFVDDLPAIAREALERGYSNPAMLCLAGEILPADPEDLRTEFREALAEAKLSVPTCLEAGDVLKRAYAEDGVRGVKSPREAAGQIVAIYRMIDDQLPGPGEYVGSNWGIADLFGLYYAYDDTEDPAVILEIDDELRRELTVVASS